jgi:hypothetical protein
MVGMFGRLERTGEPFARRVADDTVVDVPLHVEAGDAKGIVRFSADGKIAGWRYGPHPPHRRGTDMSLEVPGQIVAGEWSGLAVPAVAGTAVHYTTPWYFAVPIVLVVLGLNLWRRAAGAAGQRGVGAAGAAGHRGPGGS